MPRKKDCAALCLMALVLLVCSMVKVPRTINGAARVLPAREWLLTRTREGTLSSVLRDYARGAVESYDVYTLARGDVFQFRDHSGPRTTDFISEGDTLVDISSHELDFQLSRLSGELEIAKATLAADLAGEKVPVIHEAERALVLADENTDLQRRLFARQDSLFRKELVSREIYEMSRSAAGLAAIEGAIAEARLQTVKTGAKPEQILLIKSQIASLETQIRVMKSHLRTMVLRSPFSGVPRRDPDADTLCAVEDTARIVVMAVPIEQSLKVSCGQPVTVVAPGSGEKWVGSVTRIEQRVSNVFGRQMISVAARMEGRGVRLPVNLVMVGSLELDRVSLGRFLFDWSEDLLLEVKRAATGI